MGFSAFSKPLTMEARLGLGIAGGAVGTYLGARTAKKHKIMGGLAGGFAGDMGVGLAAGLYASRAGWNLNTRLGRAVFGRFM